MKNPWARIAGTPRRAADQSFRVGVDLETVSLMSHQFVGWEWFLIDVIFVAVFGTVLVYGVVQSRRLSAQRRQERDQTTRDQATRDLYDQQGR